MPEQERQSLQTIEKATTIMMPNGHPETFEAGTPVALIMDKIQQLQGAPSLSPFGGPTAKQFPTLTSSGDLSSLSGKSVRDLTDIGMEIGKILAGTLVGNRVSATAKAGHLMSRLTGTGLRVGTTAGIGAGQALLRNESPVKAAANEAMLQGAGEVGAPAVQILTDGFIVPVGGLYRGTNRELRRATAASQRQAARTGFWGSRPRMGSRRQVERKLDNQLGVIHDTIEDAKQAGVKLPAKDLRGVAADVKSKSADADFPITEVDRPIDEMEQRYVDEQLAKRTGQDLDNMRATLTPQMRSDDFNASFLDPVEMQGIINNKQDAMSNLAEAKARKEIIPVDREVRGLFDTGIATKAKASQEAHIPSLRRKREDAADLFTIQDIQPKLRTGLGSMAVRGSGFWAGGQAAQAMGINNTIDPKMAGIAAILTDPGAGGAFMEILAKALQASPTLKRAYDINSRMAENEGWPNVGDLRRRER
jgi:hypothetical protein